MASKLDTAEPAQRSNFVQKIGISIQEEAGRFPDLRIVRGNALDSVQSRAVISFFNLNPVNRLTKRRHESRVDRVVFVGDIGGIKPVADFTLKAGILTRPENFHLFGVRIARSVGEPVDELRATVGALCEALAIFGFADRAEHISAELKALDGEGDGVAATEA